MKNIQAILISFCTMLLLATSGSLHAGSGNCFSVTDPGPHYVSSGTICLSGSVDNLDHLIDFTVSIEAPDQVGVVQLVDTVGFDKITPNGASGGNYQFNLPLSTDGTYIIHINTLHYTAENTLSYPPSSAVITVVKLPPLDFKPTAVGNGTASISIPQGTPDDSDGDGICNGSVAVPPSPANGNKGCTAGPDTIVDYQIPANTGIVSNSASRICVQGASVNSLEISTINTITDTDGFSPARVITLSEGPNKVTKGTDAIFCPDGFVVSLTKIAHGTNQVQVTLNQVTGDGEVKTQSFDVIFQADLKGPHFTPTYTSNSKVVATPGQPTPVILMSEVGDQLMVKISAGETLSSAKSEFDEFEGCSGPLCARLKGEKKWREVTPMEGSYQFTISQDELKFPLNFIELVGWDSVGNKSTETHSFAFGAVRHPFKQGKLSPMDGLISNAVGGFLSEEYVTGALKKDLEHFFDSEEFKLNLFPKLFTVEQPSKEEAETCGGNPDKFWEDSYFSKETGLGTLEGSRIFEKTGLVTFLHTPKKGDPGYDQSLKEINDMDVTIPMMQLLNENTILVQLSIENFKRKAEIFTVRFDEYEANRPENVDKIPGKILGPNDPEFGQIVKDNTLGLTVLPVKFNIKDLDLYLKVQVFKDQDGRLDVEISPAPNAPAPPEDSCPKEADFLLKGIGYEGRLLKFDCGGDKTIVHDSDGMQLSKETGLCETIAELNEDVNQCPFDPNKFNQNLDERFKTILSATVACNLPFKVERQLAKFEEEAAMQTTLEVGDYCLSMDVFAPLGKADLSSKTWGLYFGSDAFLMPAGFEKIKEFDGDKFCPEEEEDEDIDYFEKEHNAYKYTDQKILGDLKKDKRFGAIYEPLDLSDDLVVAPEMVAQEVGSSINLAVGEELINSVIFSAGLLLDNLMKEQGNKLESTVLDLDQKKLIEDLQIGVESDCFTKKADNDDAFDNWKCFPQPLLLDKAFASVNSDALVQQIISQKPKIPLLIRTHLNPYSPPVVRLNWGAPLEDPSLMSVLLEIDLGSSLMEFFEEELDPSSGDLGTGTGVIKDWCDDDRANSEKIKMNPAKCQAGDILPIMSFNTTGKLTLELNLSVENDVLVVSGGLASKIVSEPKKDDQGNVVKDKKGKIIKIPVVKLDESKSFLTLNAVENNTLTSNSALSGDVSGRINDMVLTQYVAGADLGEAQEEVRFRIPLVAPVLKGKGSFCDDEAHSEDAICECDKPEKKNDLECKLINQVDDLINSLGIKKYGFGGGSIEELLLSITEEEFGAPRYLMMGIVPDLLYVDPSGSLGTTGGPLTVKPKFDPKKADQWKPEQEWEPEEEEQYWEDKTPPWWKWW